MAAICYKVYCRQISNFSSVVHVARCVDGRGKFADLHLEALLNLVQHFFVLVRLHEGDCETFGAESASTTHTVQVAVGLGGHVKVEHDVDLLNVDTTSENLGGHQDTVLELLEALVNFDSVLSVSLQMKKLTFLLGEFLCG